MIQLVHQVASRTCFLSQIVLFRNISYLRQSDEKLKLVFENSFLKAVHLSYMPQFPLLVLLDKHKSIFNSKNILHPSIMSFF